MKGNEVDTKRITLSKCVENEVGRVMEEVKETIKHVDFIEEIETLVYGTEQSNRSTNENNQVFASISDGARIG